ncbi:nucleotide pyrophosphohydrolase [Oleiharenicola lentus]|uniref:Nucleotide pyrophosphohydrolase n=1 Tax=Oleiharenicola lentus TaxID=2508720 RepID=A0A4Q1C6A3_9BACT|nr:MazG nucleotide pyrophosphohydrolase domain-containing protein [Oleiharenicola lentus]RXK53859.1 nucleotide pyrophosphohydrolase [Oleiharenicola lentus]
MELSSLSDRALEIHAAFAERARRTGQRPWTREEVMQGFVGDVGDLMKLVMAKAGVRPIADTDRKLAHELSDCLWSVLVLARLYQVDLGKEFFRTMDELEKKLQAPDNT